MRYSQMACLLYFFCIFQLSNFICQITWRSRATLYRVHPWVYRTRFYLHIRMHNLNFLLPVLLFYTWWKKNTSLFALFNGSFNLLMNLFIGKLSTAGLLSSDCSDDDSKPAVESLPTNKYSLFYSLTRSTA